jgi:hypothetical protein
MKKVDKFKDFEERLNNQHIIENMIKVGFSVTKGEKQEVLVPKNGEFLVLKSKVYQDPSIALRIPIHDLLDGTKTSEELKKKFSGIISNLMQQEGLAEATDRETVFEVPVRSSVVPGPTGGQQWLCRREIRLQTHHRFEGNHRRAAEEVPHPFIRPIQRCERTRKSE